MHYYVGFCVSWLLFSGLGVTSVFLCEVVFAGGWLLLWVFEFVLVLLRIGSLVVFGGLGFRAWRFSMVSVGFGCYCVSWCLIGLVFGDNVLAFDLFVVFVML